MNLRNTWPCAIAVVLTAAITAIENRSAAQTLPEPIGEEADYDSEFSQPAAPDQEQERSLLSGRPRLGITLDSRFQAAVVRTVTPGGPADAAGLKPGDTIESLNGNRIASYHDVLDFVASMRPADIVDIDFSRRITGRTQAVIDGAAAGDSAPTYPERGTYRGGPVDQATYEQLPEPNSTGRERQTAPRRDFTSRYREPEGEREADRDDRAGDRDERRRGRDSDRDREPQDRGRGLFRLFRN